MKFFAIPQRSITDGLGSKIVTRLNSKSGDVEIVAGDGIFVTMDGNHIVISTTSGGSISSVGIVAPSEFTVANSPITSSGNITLSWATQLPNLIFASPTSTTGVPTFRTLVEADLPGHSLISSHTASGLTTGHFLRATSATTFAFQPLIAGDLPSHTHSASDITSGTLSLTRGGTGASLTAPGSNQLLYYNFGGTSSSWLGIGSGLQISSGALQINSSSLGLVSGTGVTITGATVNVNTAANLTWTGTHTFNQPITFASGQTLPISKLYKAGPVAGEFVYYNGSAWTTFGTSGASNRSVLTALSGVPTWVPATKVTLGVIAYNNGATDISTIFQNTLTNDLPNGGELVIPEGTYLLSEYVTWTPSVANAKLVIRGIGNVVIRRDISEATPLTVQGSLFFNGKLSTAANAGYACIDSTPAIASMDQILESDLSGFYTVTKIILSGDRSAVLKRGTLVKLVSDNMLVASLKQTPTVTLTGSVTYTITVDGQTTGSLTQASTINDIQRAVELLSSVGLGCVVVTGSSSLFTLTFNYEAHPNVAFAVSTTKVSGGGTVSTPANDTIQRSGESSVVAADAVYNGGTGKTTVYLAGTLRTWLDGYSVNPRLFIYDNSSVEISNITFDCTDDAFATSHGNGFINLNYMVRSSLDRIVCRRSSSPAIISSGHFGLAIRDSKISNARDNAAGGFGVAISQSSHTFVSNCQFEHCGRAFTTRALQTPISSVNDYMVSYGRSEYSLISNCIAVGCEHTAFDVQEDAWMTTFDNCTSQHNLGGGFKARGFYTSFSNCNDYGSAGSFTLSPARGAYITGCRSIDATSNPIVVSSNSVSELDSPNHMAEIMIHNSQVLLSRIRKNISMLNVSNQTRAGRSIVEVRNCNFKAGVSNHGVISANLNETTSAWDSGATSFIGWQANNAQIVFSDCELDTKYLNSAGTETITGISTTNSSILITPATVNVATAGTAGVTSYSYQVSAVNAIGETVASAVTTISTGNASLTGSNYNIITWTSVPHATSYRIYGRISGSLQFLAEVTNAHSYSDMINGFPLPAAYPLANNTVDASGTSGGNTTLTLRHVNLIMSAGSSQTLSCFTASGSSICRLNDVTANMMNSTTGTIFKIGTTGTGSLNWYWSIVGRDVVIDTTGGSLTNFLTGGNNATIAFQVENLKFAGNVPSGYWYDQSATSSATQPYIFASWTNDNGTDRVKSSAFFTQQPKAGFTLKTAPLPDGEVSTIESTSVKLPGPIDQHVTILLESCPASYTSASVRAPHHQGQRFTIVNMSGFAQILTDAGGSLANNSSRSMFFNNTNWVVDGTDRSLTVSSGALTILPLPAPAETPTEEAIEEI